MSNTKVIGIFGGTGALGSALSRKWSKSGHQIIIGSRNAEKAISVADEINAEIGNGDIRRGPMGGRKGAHNRPDPLQKQLFRAK